MKGIDVLDAPEIQCLLYAAWGFTARETSLYLPYAHNTVRDYRQSAIGKLRADTITHAVVLAILAGDLSINQLYTALERTSGV